MDITFLTGEELIGEADEKGTDPEGQMDRTTFRRIKRYLDELKAESLSRLG